MKIVKTIIFVSVLTTLIVTGINVINNDNFVTKKDKEEIQKLLVEEEEKKNAPKIVYDGLTLEELGDKLNRSLNSTLSNKGYLFASKSIELGIDPYLAVAISLHETGCKWSCSTLVKSCNNIGGMKGKPSCGGGSYVRFSTLDQGIISYLEGLKRNYFDQGLNTPDTIARKYTGYYGSPWASKVKNYINEIKNK